MIKFPNAKINLGLRVTNKREDGYHDLQTIFYPVLFKDALEFIAEPSATSNKFTQTGFPVPGETKDNLCLKAYELIKKIHPEIPFLNIHLHKTIPMGAGLGGGSADAAFMLQMLNENFCLKLEDNILAELALKLGSDCPFFLLNKPAYAEGRGEKLKPVDLDLSAYKILIVNPGIHVPTGWAFSQLQPAPPDTSLEDIIKLPVASWKDFMLNDFEQAVFNAHPKISELKSLMYSAGALYASMTGSGSTVFGIFPVLQKDNIILPDGCFKKWI